MVRNISILLLVLAAADASADPFRPVVSLLPGTPSTGGDITLRLRGQWPDSCTPEVLDTARDDKGFVVRLFYRSEGCAKQTTEYQVDAVIETEGSLEQGIYPVRIYARGEGDALFRLVAFDLMESGSPDRFRPESGIWWPRAGDDGVGVGFSLEFQGAKTVMLANVYDANGDPVWMIGSGTLRGHVLKADLMMFTGGQPMFGEQGPPEEAAIEAQAYVEFHTRATATLWFAAPLDGGAGSQLLLQPIEIARYAFGYGAGPFVLAGRWLLLQGQEVTELDLYPNLVKRNDNRALLDRRQGWRVECDARSDLPTGCALLDADDGLIGEFYDVGLDRMIGADAEGRPIEAIRID